LKADAQRHPRPFDYILFEDTSRLGNLRDALAFEKLMQHYGIKVCFVSEKLDSGDPTFHIMLAAYGMFSELYIPRLRAEVLSAQKGSTLDRFTAGRGPTVIARCLLKLIESEAEVIRRIFQLNADGYSMDEISLKLNVEKHSPQNSRSGKTVR
jgi:DNA invertase Pin-like site-specific DNA recombinase